MFEQHFNFLHTPFIRDIPEDALFQNDNFNELLNRLEYVVRQRLFAVVTGVVGAGKTTAIRKLVKELDRNMFDIIYISDSALTPRVFYWEVLSQMGTDEKPSFYRSEGKRKMMQEIKNLREIKKKTPIIIVDEAHLLSREMLQETRFLLNCNMDSYNPMSLIMVGQSELRDTLKKEIYEAISQRIDLKYHLNTYDRAQTEEYIKSHLKYAGENRDIYSADAIDVIYENSKGIARKVNKICTGSLIHAYQINKRIIDASMVSLVIEEEINW